MNPLLCSDTNSWVEGTMISSICTSCTDGTLQTLTCGSAQIDFMQCGSQCVSEPNSVSPTVSPTSPTVSPTTTAPTPHPTRSPGYDEDPREEISPYYVDKSYHFIVGANFDQVTICEIGDELSYTDAMNKAVELATERNAYGFFYQHHPNGYQIVGFYTSQDDMEGEKVSDGNLKRGCIAQLASPSPTTTAPTPFPTPSPTDTPVTSPPSLDVNDRAPTCNQTTYAFTVDESSTTLEGIAATCTDLDHTATHKYKK